MGKVLYQSMTRKEEDIQTRRQALPSNQQLTLKYYTEPTAPCTPLQENIEPSNAVVPFEPNFDNQEVPDFDLVSILNDMEKEQSEKNS